MLWNQNLRSLGQPLRTQHQLVLRRSQPDDAGRYRKVQVWIRGAVHVPPTSALVPALMADLFRDLAAWATDHPVWRAARLAANLLLRRAGCPIAIISPADRAAYFAALAAFDEGRKTR